jgi:hypothetical protein
VQQVTTNKWPRTEKLETTPTYYVIALQVRSLVGLDGRVMFRVSQSQDQGVSQTGIQIWGRICFQVNSDFGKKKKVLLSVGFLSFLHIL